MTKEKKEGFLYVKKIGSDEVIVQSPAAVERDEPGAGEQFDINRPNVYKAMIKFLKERQDGKEVK